jgi:BlaI family transcriptional regulator, penicillinase repressor
MSSPRFGRMQHRIMQILWEKKTASARDITDILNKDEVVAHSTVQTLLRKLEVKGAVGHKSDDRTFVFFPLVEEKKAVRSATRELVDRVFSGSFAGLMAHLLENEKIPKAEMEQIKKLLDERKP